MPRLSHAELQSQIKQLLDYTGWEHLYVRKSRGRGSQWATTTNTPGWPDMCPLWNARQPGRHLAIEVKVPPDKLSADQEAVRLRLIAGGFEYRVITEAELLDGTLSAWLRPIRGA